MYKNGCSHYSNIPFRVKKMTPSAYRHIYIPARVWMVKHKLRWILRCAKAETSILITFFNRAYLNFFHDRILVPAFLREWSQELLPFHLNRSEINNCSDMSMESETRIFDGQIGRPTNRRKWSPIGKLLLLGYNKDQLVDWPDPWLPFELLKPLLFNWPGPWFSSGASWAFTGPLTCSLIPFWISLSLYWSTDLALDSLLELLEPLLVHWPGPWMPSGAPCASTVQLTLSLTPFWSSLRLYWTTDLVLDCLLELLEPLLIH